jgi:menaquinone-dependent protoporphyrinogen oxidase
MVVLVAHASTHGSTREIAERLAARLCEQGLPAQCWPVAEVMDQAGLAAYDAFVVGSAIHGGDWLPEGASFLSRNREVLAAHPVWLFSVSTVGEGSSAFPPRVARRMRGLMRVPQAVTAIQAEVRPRDHHAFAGVIHRGDWGLSGRVFLRTFGGRFGDHRDWQEIDGWAMTIAGELRPGRRCRA